MLLVKSIVCDGGGNDLVYFNLAIKITLLL